MSNAKQVKIIWDTSIAAYRLTAPFIKQLKEFMSRTVPHSDRYWDANQNNWVFVERQLPNVQAVLKIIGADVTLISKQQVEDAAKANQQSQQQQQAAVQRNALEPVVMQFVRTVPYDSMKKAYLHAAMQLHPDKNGGDGSRMTALNESWYRIAKEIYGQ